MTKLIYLAAMALVGLGLTMAQNTSSASDPSNSSQQSQTQNSTNGKSAKAGRTGHPSESKSNQRPQDAVPDTTVQDQPGSTTSTTGASGQNSNDRPASKMGTTGNTQNPAPEGRRTTEPQSGTSTDQQPNSSSSPSSSAPPNMAANTTPAARAMATHTPDPGTCMNPASLGNGQDSAAAQRPSPNCD